MIVKSTGYVKGTASKRSKRQLSAHIKYLQHAKYGEHEKKEDRRIFNDKGEQYARLEAVNDVYEHTSNIVNYHKIVLSPSTEEARGIDDYYQWTKDIMNDLEEHLGLELHWYAVKQAPQREQTDIPHVHVVLAGAGENSVTGKIEAVRLYTKGRDFRNKDRDDFEFMRQSAIEHAGHDFYQELDTVWADLDQSDDTALNIPERDFDHSF